MKEGGKGDATYGANGGGDDDCDGKIARARSLLLPLLSTFASLDRNVSWRKSHDPKALASAMQGENL